MKSDPVVLPPKRPATRSDPHLALIISDFGQLF